MVQLFIPVLTEKERESWGQTVCLHPYSQLVDGLPALSARMQNSVSGPGLFQLGL